MCYSAQQLHFFLERVLEPFVQESAAGISRERSPRLIQSRVDYRQVVLDDLDRCWLELTAPLGEKQLKPADLTGDGDFRW